MSVTLTPAINGSGAIDAAGNTYATLAEADAYFALRPNATSWTGETDDDVRSKLLLWAMRSLDGLGWIGIRYSITQPLDWPRTANKPVERTPPYGSGYHLGYTASYGLFDLRGRYWAANAIPDPLKTAQFEQALAVQQNTLLSTADPYKKRIIKNNQGSIEFKTGSDLTGLTSFAAGELIGLVLTGAGVQFISR